MITHKDRKAMSLSARKPVWYTVGLLLFPLLFIATFVKDLYLASVLAKLGGYTLGHIAKLWWWTGVSMSAQYSGFELAAIVRLERSVYALALTIGASGMAVAAFIHRNREARIVEELKAAGRWDNNA